MYIGCCVATTGGMYIGCCVATMGGMFIGATAMNWAWACTMGWPAAARMSSSFSTCVSAHVGQHRRRKQLSGGAATGLVFMRSAGMMVLMATQLPQFGMQL